MIAIIEVARASGRTPEEVADQLFAAMAGKKDGGLLGLERKPSERKGKTTPEAALLTVRSDLVSMRERLLKGAGRRATLRDLDYTIDQLDNALGEM